MNQQAQAVESCTGFYNKLVEEGPVANIGDLVHSPLGSGYFFKFCKSKYCSETTNFVIEVDKYIEIFSSDDGGWEDELSWKEIDRELIATGAINGTNGPINIQQDIIDRINTDEFISAANWPSGKVDRLLVLDKIRLIWSRFLSEGSPDQICLPASVLLNTCRRMQNVHIYGREVFQEASKDPGITSTLRDIAARFQSSEEYAQCLRRFQELTKPPCNVSIHIPGPRHTLTAMYTRNQLVENEPAVVFTLDQFLSDNFLYGEFMAHLKRIMASENLRFIRAVHIFKKSFTNTDLSTHKKAADWAFKMYMNFLRPGSAYEVCVTEVLRRDVARSLASPHIDLFQHVEKITWGTLKGLFESYALTPEYTHLRLKLAEKFDDFDTQMKIKAAQGSMSYTTLNSKLSMARVLREGGSANNSHSQVRPTPPGSGRRGVNTFHHSVQSTLVQGGLSIGSTITAGLGGLVSSVVPSHPRGRQPRSARSTNAVGSTGSNRSTNSGSQHMSIRVSHANTTSNSAEDTAMHIDQDTSLTDPISTHNAIHTNTANLTIVTAPADPPLCADSTASHPKAPIVIHNNSQVDNTACTLAASSLSTAATPVSTSSRLNQGRAIPLNSASAELSTRSALPSIPAAGSTSEEEGDGDNAHKIQKTNNSMFGGGVYLPVLNFLGCMPNA